MSEVRRQGHAGLSSQWSDDCRVRDSCLVGRTCFTLRRKRRRSSTIWCVVTSMPVFPQTIARGRQPKQFVTQSRHAPPLVEYRCEPGRRCLQD